uniref:Telomeric repeat binding factor (NIMA-interacting) 1 n=1 Tax=Amphilophus citrinellus TaxID=61819 RepID=A0A3Q0QNW0_AMPCI
DVQFEDDDTVMPLMSAAKIWSDLEHTVSDQSLFKNITILLVVQVIVKYWFTCSTSTVCFTSYGFHSFFNFMNTNVLFLIKLSKIVEQRETYHPFLMSFSFSRLLETVQSYLDAYLEKNPSDYLLKVQNLQECFTSQPHVIFLSLNASKIISNLAPSELSQMTSENSEGTLTVQKIRKPPQVSRTNESPYQINEYINSLKHRNCEFLDKYLKDGVKRHGQGKWSRILMDYDFEGRTGTMLKDRWRVLMRAHEVG